jgi:hypothetical protein
MGNNSNTKQMRGQLRQIVKETFAEMFTEEVKNQMLKELLPTVKASLDAVQAQVSAATTKRMEEVNMRDSVLLKDAGTQLETMNIAMLSWQLLLTEKLESKDFIGAEFKEELEEMKKNVRERLTAPVFKESSSLSTLTTEEVV